MNDVILKSGNNNRPCVFCVAINQQMSCLSAVSFGDTLRSHVTLEILSLLMLREI